MQKAPARQLPNLAKMPIAIVHGEASFHAPFEHCTVKYLNQAGMTVEWMPLDARKIYGNGHMVMIEKNNLDIARLVDGWLQNNLR